MPLLRSPDGTWTEDVPDPVVVVNLKSQGYYEVPAEDTDAPAPVEDGGPANDTAHGEDGLSVVVNEDVHEDF